MLVRQAMLKYVASALLPELLTDVATGVDQYVSYVPATIVTPANCTSLKCARMEATFSLAILI
jgi:hypothetical protein